MYPRNPAPLTYGPFTCGLHTPPATKSRFAGRAEVASHLAPAAPARVYLVDDYAERCPAHWVRSSEKSRLRTAFIAAEPGHMVWFDFNGNAQHQNDVAVILAAQNVNALTGGPIIRRAALIQFYHFCPKHPDRPFETADSNKFCPECGFAWPDQNYLSTTSCPPGAFWRDGFRWPDGQTREFVFTEDEERGVAANVIGDARSDAFDVYFFESLSPKPRPAYRDRRYETFGGGLESLGGPVMRGYAATPKSVEVAAGAMVAQQVGRDEKRPDHWRLDPSAHLRIYFAHPDDVARIVGQRPAPTGGAGPFGDVGSGH